MTQLTPEERTTLNKACENLRKEGKDLHNADEKRKTAKKQIERILKSDSDKFRKPSQAGSDGLKEVQES